MKFRCQAEASLNRSRGAFHTFHQADSAVMWLTFRGWLSHLSELELKPLRLGQTKAVMRCYYRKDAWGIIGRVIARFIEKLLLVTGSLVHDDVVGRGMQP